MVKPIKSIAMSNVQTPNERVETDPKEILQELKEGQKAILKKVAQELKVIALKYAMRDRFRHSRITSFPVLLSKAAVGSSAKKSLGLPTRARAIATRCF